MFAAAGFWHPTKRKDQIKQSINQSINHRANPILHIKSFAIKELFFLRFFTKRAL
jgi:hypothetical protein